ncbi:acyl-CoA dehydrogenase [candidate division CSSED10-310 bacterium]|uniref:Acyl-CoA dehydrogenase n=1 Tax=candidate division CSSED10-310 bacterium TaxID=2855610 RepID=A0ABV6YYI1_UNCC1
MLAKHYLANVTDIKFNLFDVLQVTKLLEFEKYKEIEADDISMVLETAAEVAEQELAPSYAVADREGCTFKEGQVTIPKSIHQGYQLLIEQGWMTVGLDSEHEGQGFPLVVATAVAELLTGPNLPLSTYFGLTEAVVDFIIAFGTEEMKKIYLPPLLAGKWSGTMVMTEPDVGSAVGDLRTTAEKKDSSYYISGTKSFITAGAHDMTENVVHIVLARLKDAPPGIKGLSIFLVPTYRPDQEGSRGEFNDVICTGIEEKMGLHGSVTCSLAFGEEGKCLGYLIGEENKGIKYLFRMMNRLRIATGLSGLTLASTAYLNAREYAKTRIQGVKIQDFRDVNAPRVPLIEHPDIRRMLMLMKSRIEGMRALLLDTSYRLDLSNTHPDEKVRGLNSDMVDLLTPICKAYVTDHSFEITSLAMQVMGGVGYTGDYPVEQYMRDIRVASIYEGANGIQALDFLGRKLPLKKGKVFFNLVAEIDRFIHKSLPHSLLGRELSLLGKYLNIYVNGVAEATGLGMGLLKLQRQTTANVGSVRWLKNLGNSFSALVSQFYRELSVADYDFKKLSLVATPEKAALHAVGLVEITGDILVAYALLKHALVAVKKLTEIRQEMKVPENTPWIEFAKESETAAYYIGKIESARFFIHHCLPRILALQVTMASKNSTILDLPIASF